MNKAYYYGGTLGLYGLGIIGGILISDIGTLFGFVGAIVSSTLTFLLPGGFFLIAQKKFTPYDRSKKARWLRYSSWMMVVLGVLNFAFLFIGNVLGILYSQ